MDSKVCFITNFWLGSRRYEYPKYKEDKLYFLKQQIKCLQTYDHNLTKIIFNFNIIPEQYHYISKIFAITPKQIQGAEVEINIRENIGISYGAWSDLFGKYRSEYDYYVFNEDDYFFVQNNWDSYLVNKYNSHSDCGYLCMVIREPAQWNKFKKHAGSSVGIASTENLMKIYSKYGKLPSLDENLVGKEGNYEGWSDIQLDFGFVFLELGLNIYDVRDDYAILFQKGISKDPSILAWKFHSYNQEYLQVAPFYFEGNFRYWKSTDLEFLPDYEVTTHKEAMYCYDRSLPYHDNGVDENGVFTGWIKKTYYFDS